MKMSRWIIIIFVIFAGAFAIFVNETVLEWRMNQKVQKALQPLQTGDEVTFAEILPIAWTEMYVFEPYTPKEVASEAVGQKIKGYRESVNDGTLQLVVLRDDKIVYYASGYPSHYGYVINDYYDGEPFTPETVFQVERNDAIVYFTRMNKEND